MIGIPSSSSCTACNTKKDSYLHYHLLMIHQHCFFCETSVENPLLHANSAEHKFCNDCETVFKTKGLYTDHHKQYHQNSITITFNNGPLTVYRNSDGFFHCICKKQKYTHPTSFHKHWKTCNGVSVPSKSALRRQREESLELETQRQPRRRIQENESDSEESINEDSISGSESEVIESQPTYTIQIKNLNETKLVYMDGYPLAYNTDIDAVVCIECGQGLIDRNVKSLDNHIRKFHQRIYKVTDTSALISSFLGTRLNTFTEKASLFIANAHAGKTYAEGIKIYKEAYKCHICGVIALSANAVSSHIRKNHVIQLLYDTLITKG
jgi:hypothetical protein